MWFAAEANSSVVVVLIKPLGTRKTARLEVLVKFKFQSKTLKFLEKNRVTPQISNNMPQICGFLVVTWDHRPGPSLRVWVPPTTTRCEAAGRTTWQSQ